MIAKKIFRWFNSSMHISPIYTLPQYNEYLPVQKPQDRCFGLNLKPQLTQDVVNFTGYRRFLDLPKNEIFARIKQSLRPDNFLGAGGEANVYLIKGTKYCFRWPKGTADAYKTNLDFDISESDKVNHVVARLGAGATIMTRLKGVPVKADSMTVEQIQQVAQAIVDFPVQSYRTFLHQIADADKKNMYFDNFWPNIIINPKEKTITAIDFVKDFQYGDEFSPLGQMFSALTHEETTIDQLGMIANKIFQAALKELAPGQKPCIKPTDFDFALFLTDLRNLGKFNLQDESYCDLFNALERVVELKELELQGQNVTNMLRNDIAVAKEIIDLMF